MKTFLAITALSGVAWGQLGGVNDSPVVSFEFDQCSCVTEVFTPDLDLINFGDVILGRTVGTCPFGVDGTDKYFPLSPGARFFSAQPADTLLTPGVFRANLAEPLDLSEFGATLEFWIKPLDLMPQAGEEDNSIGLISFNNQFDNIIAGYGIVVSAEDSNGDFEVTLTAYTSFIPEAVVEGVKLTENDRDQPIHIVFTILPETGDLNNVELRCLEGNCREVAPLATPSGVRSIDLLYGNSGQLTTAEGSGLDVLMPSTVDLLKFVMHNGTLEEAQIEALFINGVPDTIGEPLASHFIESSEDAITPVTVQQTEAVQGFAAVSLSNVELEVEVEDEVFVVTEESIAEVEPPGNVFSGADGCNNLEDFFIFGDVTVVADELACPQLVPVQLCLAEVNDPPTMTNARRGSIDAPDASRGDENVFSIEIGEDPDSAIGVTGQSASGTTIGGFILLEAISQGQLFNANNNGCGSELTAGSEVQVNDDGTTATICFTEEVSFAYRLVDSNGLQAEDTAELTITPVADVGGDPDPDDDDGNSGAAVAFGIIGVLVVLVVVGYFGNKKMKERKENEQQNEEKQNVTHYTQTGIGANGTAPPPASGAERKSVDNTKTEKKEKSVEEKMVDGEAEEKPLEKKKKAKPSRPASQIEAL